MAEDINVKKIQQDVIRVLTEVNRVAIEGGLSYYLAYGTALGAVRNAGMIPWDMDCDIVVEASHYQTFCDTLRGNLRSEYVLFDPEMDSSFEHLFCRVGLKGVSHHDVRVDVFPLAGTPAWGPWRWLFTRIVYQAYRWYFVKSLDPRVNYASNRKKLLVSRLVRLMLLPLPRVSLRSVFRRLLTMYPSEYSDFVFNACGSYGSREIIPRAWLGQPAYLSFEGQALPVPQEWDRYLRRMYNDYMKPKRVNYGHKAIWKKLVE